MKTLLLPLLAALSLLILLLWLTSYPFPREHTFITHQNTYHLATRQGALSLATFSNIPEDDSYKSLTLPYWLLSTATLLPTCLLIYLHLKRRHTPKPGFPI